MSKKILFCFIFIAILVVAFFIFSMKIDLDTIDNQVFEFSEAELIFLLYEPNVAEIKRISAIKKLGEMKSYSAVSGLIDLLKRPSHGNTIAAEAAKSLGEIGDERAIQYLIKSFYNNVGDDLTYESSSALLKFGKSAMPELINSLKDEDLHFRGEVIYLLGEMQDDSAMPVLANLLLQGKEDESDQAESALEKFGSKSIPIFEKALVSDMYYVRENAMVGLGAVPWPQDVDFTSQLEVGLNDVHYKVRMQAARALGRLRSISSEWILEEALEKETNQAVKEKINWALEIIRGRSKFCVSLAT